MTYRAADSVNYTMSCALWCENKTNCECDRLVAILNLAVDQFTKVQVESISKSSRPGHCGAAERVCCYFVSSSMHSDILQAVNSIALFKITILGAIRP